MQRNFMNSYTEIDTPALLNDHYEIIQDRWDQALTACQLDVVILHAGAARFILRMTKDLDFKPTPTYCNGSLLSMLLRTVA